MIAVSLRYESYMQSLHDLWSGAVRRPGWLLCLVSCYLLCYLCVGGYGQAVEHAACASGPLICPQ